MADTPGTCCAGHGGKAGPEACIFCRFARGEAKPYLVWEDATHMAFLDIRPINPGHVLVIPRRHVPDIIQLSDEEYSALMLSALRLAKHIKKVLSPRRVGYAVEGFGVDHVHVHLVPLHRGMELNPHRARHTNEAELAEMARLLRSVPVGE